MYKLFLILCLLGTDCKDIDQREYIQSEKLFENINDCQNYPYSGWLDSILIAGKGCKWKTWGLVCLDEKYDPRNPNLKLIPPEEDPTSPDYQGPDIYTINYGYTTTN